jgi:predicted transcriptional regulator
MVGTRIIGERSRMEIVADILTSCAEGGSNKTSIMYGNNLSYAQLQRYLLGLEASGLIVQDGSGKYGITPAGRTALVSFERALSALQELLT